jgi:hypothetical protein
MVLRPTRDDVTHLRAAELYDRRECERMSRFTLRGQAKVSTQWQLYCLVHNIEKIATRAMRMAQQMH